MHKAFKQILISSLSGLLIYTYLGYSISSQLPDWGKFYGEILGFLLAAIVIGWLTRFWLKGLNKLLPWEKKDGLKISGPGIFGHCGQHHIAVGFLQHDELVSNKYHYQILSLGHR